MNHNASLQAPRFLLLSLLSALLLLGACQTTESGIPNQAEIVNELTTTAEVVALEPATRLMTLRREDGRLLAILAGDEVRNFDQIDVGDKLRVRYLESLAATLLPPGTDTSPAQAAFAAGRAQPGAKPGAGIGVLVSLAVKIESIDLKNDLVVFSLDTGELIAHRVATPEGRAFVKGLEHGDTVQLDFTEALALSIEEL